MSAKFKFVREHAKNHVNLQSLCRRNCHERISDAACIFHHGFDNIDSALHPRVVQSADVLFVGPQNRDSAYVEEISLDRSMSDGSRVTPPIELEQLTVVINKREIVRVEWCIRIRLSHQRGDIVRLGDISRSEKFRRFVRVKTFTSSE